MKRTNLVLDERLLEELTRISGEDVLARSHGIQVSATPFLACPAVAMGANG